MTGLNLLVVILVSQVALIYGRDCFVRGECGDGSRFIEEKIVSRKVDCLNFCKETIASGHRCSHFTYYQETNMCLLFSSCNRQTSNCTDCLYGETTCSNEFKCDVSGICEGNVLEHVQTCSDKACYQKCKEDLGCNYYSYHLNDGVCITFSTCTINSGTSSTCFKDPWITGQSLCEPKTIHEEEILTIGLGLSNNNNTSTYPKPSSEMNIINAPACGSASTTCQPPAPYPGEAANAISTVFSSDNKLRVCGGESQMTCHSYDNGSWVNNVPNIPEARIGMSAIYTSKGWWVTGGKKGSYVYDSTYLYDEVKGEWVSGMDLPASLYGHCIAHLEGDEYVLTGGCSNSYNCQLKDEERYAYSINIATGQWKQIASMRSYRVGHTCIGTKIQGSPSVLVVGGGSSVSINSEFYNAKLNTWSSQTSISLELENGILAESDGFPVYIGGQSNNLYSDKIYMLTANCWVELEERLPMPLIYPIAYSRPLSECKVKAMTKNPATTNIATEIPSSF